VLLVYLLPGFDQVDADDDNVLGGSIHSTRKITGALVVASKKIGLEVNADNTKYIVMSRLPNAGRSSIQILTIFRLKGCKNADIWKQP
jgi:hypothetical protein